MDGANEDGARAASGLVPGFGPRVQPVKDRTTGARLGCALFPSLLSVRAPRATLRPLPPPTTSAPPFKPPYPAARRLGWAVDGDAVHPVPPPPPAPAPPSEADLAQLADAVVALEA